MALSNARIHVYRNPHYKKSGLKSYVWLLKKYDITPTKEGPYFRSAKVSHQGKLLGKLKSFLKPASGPGGGHTHVTPTQLLVKNPTTGATGQVGSDDIQNDSLYLSPVSIGTPAQTLYLDFDSGSSDLWVWSTELPSNVQSQATPPYQTVFDPSKSSTWKASKGSTWKISYGDGSSASGDVGTDTVVVGGVSIEGQAVEVAKTMSQSFVSGAGSGLLGLAFGNINTVQPTPVKTPVENMIAQGDIPKTAELFTAYLGSWRDANDPDQGKSFYTFGYIDQDVLKAADATAPSYTPVDSSQGFWKFASASYTINGKTHKLAKNTAIADTGTTLCLVSDTVCEAIYKAIPGAKYDSTQQGYIFPTNTAASKLPTVGFAVGNKIFTINKEDLGFADAGNGFVYGGIQSRGSMTFDILGDTFLKNIYAIFDLGNKQFGAVQRTEPTNLEPPPSASAGGNETVATTETTGTSEPTSTA